MLAKIKDDWFRQKKLDILPKLLGIIAKEKAKQLVIEGMLNAD